MYRNMSTVEIEDEVKEELFHIQENTNDDGTVNVEIEEWSKKHNALNEERVEIKFRKPTQEVKTEVMQWPQRATEEYKFYRIVKNCGYDLYNADQIEGCKIKYDGGKIIAPKKKSRIQKLRQSIQNPSNASPTEQIIILITWPIAVCMLFMMFMDRGSDVKEVVRGAVISSIGWAVWGLAIFTLIMLI
jgi:hypothetical protein